jgi:hypothetical protein
MSEPPEPSWLGMTDSTKRQWPSCVRDDDGLSVGTARGKGSPIGVRVRIGRWTFSWRPTPHTRGGFRRLGAHGDFSIRGVGVFMWMHHSPAVERRYSMVLMRKMARA